MAPKKKRTLNVAIIGAGRTCRFFLDFLNNFPFTHLSVNIVGVCDRNPHAVGMRKAREMGLFTSQAIDDVLAIEELEGIIELTNDREVLLDLIRRKPSGVWVLDHDIGSLLRDLLGVYQKLLFTEQEVALERALFETLLREANEPIMLMDPDYVVVDANEGYLRRVNRSREETIGRKCYEVIYGFNSPCPEWQPEMGCPMQETLRTGERARVIHERYDGEGSPNFCDLETYPVLDREGRVFRVVEIWRDITKELIPRWHKRIEEVKANLGRLVQEDRMLTLGKLSASCAHEINNPIQGMLTFALLMRSMLTRGIPTPEDLGEFEGYLDLVCKELERCGRIVSSLLCFSRDSAVETREVDVNEILRSVVDLLKHHMELHDIVLKMQMGDSPVLVMGDLNQLQQVFLNLLLNAVDAMPRYGMLTIGSKADPQKNQAEVVVRDTGCGIARKHRDKIFDPFFTTKPSGEGTGLGLFIVYGIVRGHGGEVKVESEEGKGASFTVSLPLAPGDTHG
ncbi:MAG: PAS domain-containing protein [Deltaproteobacteria bacterium]|nr:PAS domain-containing protein [Deltaproteobacteria bacterium]